MKQKSTYIDLLNRLINREFERFKFVAEGSYFKENPPTSYSLERVLHLKEDELNRFGRLLIDFLDKQPEDYKKSYADLTWRIKAWLEFQDLMDLEMDIEGSDTTAKLNYHYCYFEATRTLIESLHSGINGYFHAAIALLRPFIELAVLEIYFREKRKKEGNYKSFQKWFNCNNCKQGQPFKNTVNYIFNSGHNRSFPVVRKRIFSAYQGTCKYVHKPRFDESFAYIRKTNTLEPSLEAIYYWIYFTSIVLQSLLWLYVVSNPICLFPVDIVKKFGYNWPIGLFADRSNALIIEKALGKQDFDAFRDDFRDNPRVRTILEWYNEQPDKTEDEIEASWQTFAKTFVGAEAITTCKAERIALTKAHLRTILWIFSYLPIENKLLEIPINDSVLEYSKTKHFFK